MIKDDWLTVCGDMAHRLDRDRLMCATVAPQNQRAALIALLAFNLEIASIPELVSEPMLGEIRLQWWRDNLESIYAGTGGDHPVALGLVYGVEKYRLSRGLFEEFLDARSFDLRGEAPVSLAALEEYADGTAGALSELMAEVMGLTTLAPESQVTIRATARHAGVAWALAGLLGSVSFHSRQGRSYLPADLVPDKKMIAVAQAARDHIRQARAVRKTLPKFMLPVMLPVFLADQRLRRIEMDGSDNVRSQSRHLGVSRMLRFYGKVLSRSF